MQRIAFLEKLEIIVARLKTKKIVEIFKLGFSAPGSPYPYNQLVPILFESKSQFDQLIKDDYVSDFLKQIAGIEIYDEKNMSNLTDILKNSLAHQILSNPISTQFYSFHSSLVDLLKISNNLLSNIYIKNSLEQNLDSGIIIFQIRIEDEGLGTSKYIKIFSALEDLVKTLESAYKVDESEPEIVMLDSGSDTNVALETKVEIGKSIFQIFKEIWDFITSLSFYRAQQRNQALLESLTVRNEILKSVESGILTAAEAKEYIHIIKTRTDDLIGMKVLPRELIANNTMFDNNRILEEYKIKVLEEKTKK